MTSRRRRGRPAGRGHRWTKSATARSGTQRGRHRGASSWLPQAAQRALEARDWLMRPPEAVLSRHRAGQRKGGAAGQAGRVHVSSGKGIRTNPVMWEPRRGKDVPRSPGAIHLLPSRASQRGRGIPFPEAVTSPSPPTPASKPDFGGTLSSSSLRRVPSSTQGPPSSVPL